jgi:hypothetical protein
MQLRLLMLIIRLTAVFVLVAGLHYSASAFGKSPLPSATKASPPIDVSGTIVNTEKGTARRYQRSCKGCQNRDFNK